MQMIPLQFLTFISVVFAKCQWSTSIKYPRSGIFRSYSEAKIICYGIDSNNIHQEIGNIFVTANYYEYVFQNSSIQNFPMNVFTSKKIDILYINNSQIETIQTGAFSGLLQVKEIYLQFNLLNTIFRGCFNALIKLKILDVSNNCIQSIEDDSFHGSNELRKIFLNDNRIATIPRLLFDSLKQLQIVNLSNNNIKKFDFSFSNYAIFKTIYLNDNNIDSIQCETLQNSFLDVIELKNNFLEDLDGSCLPKNLEELVLEGNMISFINNISVLRNLKYIDLSYNNISSFANNEFENLKTLKNLKLQNNKLDELRTGIFKGLISLDLLNLSSNFIEFLDYGIFNGLENLNSLDLSYNRLTILEEGIFQNVRNLNVLNVSYNNLQEINFPKLRGHLKFLKRIDIIGNNITCQNLSVIFLYATDKNVVIANGTYLDVPNVNGIPCTNTNLLHKNNTLEEIHPFFGWHFKNTSFFKQFSKGLPKSNETAILLTLEKYLKDSKTENKLVAQMSKNNLIFILFLITTVLICGFLLVLILMLSKLVKQHSAPLLEPELHLL